MALPTQLQEQIDNAKTIAEQVYGPKEESSTEDVSAESEDSSQDSEDASSDTQEVVTSHKTNTSSESDENNDTYAQRWRSLQGVYNAQKRQLDETQSRLANMEQLITQMQSVPMDNYRPAHVTEKDMSEYGEDMVEFARRVTREEVVPLAQAVQQLMSRIDELQGVVPVVQKVAHQQAQNTHEKFYAALSARVPDWQKVNENAGFHNWLLSADPLSGLQRQTLLTDAHNSLDLPRVVSIFETWKRENGVATAPSATAKSASVSKLERQIAPGRTSGTTPPSAAEKKQWTRQDITAFFKDKMDGKYKGREDEARKLESDIFLAQREGRVVLNAA